MAIARGLCLIEFDCACNECGDPYYEGEKAFRFDDTDGSCFWLCEECEAKRTKPKNARFWIWYRGDFESGWVKLTLIPGERVEFVGGGRTEEGYSCWSVAYHHHGDWVLAEHHSWGRDCDGLLEQGEEFHCDLADLKSHESMDGTMMPRWESADSYQRDHAAEAAGY